MLLKHAFQSARLFFKTVNLVTSCERQRFSTRKNAFAESLRRAGRLRLHEPGGCRARFAGRLLTASAQNPSGKLERTSLRQRYIRLDGLADRHWQVLWTRRNEEVQLTTPGRSSFHGGFARGNQRRDDLSLLSGRPAQWHRSCHCWMGDRVGTGVVSARNTVSVPIVTGVSRPRPTAANPGNEEAAPGEGLHSAAGTGPARRCCRLRVKVRRHAQRRQFSPLPDRRTGQKAGRRISFARASISTLSSLTKKKSKAPPPWSLRLTPAGSESPRPSVISPTPAPAPDRFDAKKTSARLRGPENAASETLPVEDLE